MKAWLIGRYWVSHGRYRLTVETFKDGEFSTFRTDITAMPIIDKLNDDDPETVRDAVRRCIDYTLEANNVVSDFIDYQYLNF